MQNDTVRKVVSDGVSKTLFRALLYGTNWMDEPNPFVIQERQIKQAGVGSGGGGNRWGI